MELNLTKRTCVIWYPRSPSKETRLHEQNHCRGWAHTTRAVAARSFMTGFLCLSLLMQGCALGTYPMDGSSVVESASS